jgi:Cof subfamily protein (haloacid dehalogenase superfamily)
MVRIIFSDLDGTFLDDEKCVPPANDCLLDLLDDTGIEFVPCSGRMLSGIPSEIIEHHCVRHAICSDGACIVKYDDSTPHVVFRDGLSADTVIELYERVRAFDIQFDVFADGKSFSERTRWERLSEFPIDPGMKEFARKQRIPMDEAVPEFVGSLHHIERLNIYLMQLEDYRPICEQIDAVGGLHYDPHSRVGIEITNERINKATGLSWIAKHEGVALSDCVALGDSDNDIPMLRIAGIGVAMANACENALREAEVITRLPNTSAGVADYLLREVLGRLVL